ncbi:cadherin-like domain-containing protein, partial [Methylobacter psychrophilus]|uniref:cadherin-like domain-containing protein n=1 Tax=Methylobacter psychrophilus TaxID=96941 RepID=UPI0021D4A1C7
QVGKVITVQASYTDGLSNPETKLSSATTAVVNVNDAPTGTVTITGTSSQHHDLTATNSLADIDGLGPITYQWLADGIAIEGAISTILTLGQAQVGKVITVTASYIDQQNTPESISSSATKIVNSNNAPTGSVTITGTATQNEILTATNTLEDIDVLGTISYQWLADNVAITNATTNTLILTQAEVGKAITVTASYSDGQNTAESVISSATTAVINVNDAPTTSLVTLLSITEDSQARVITQAELLGKAVDLDGNNLTAAGLSITSGNGTLVDNLNGTWSYTPSLNDDASVSFNYTITDSVSPTAGTVAATATLDITPVNDLPTGTVTITGTATQHQVLTATNTLADVDGLGTISYQWLADGLIITGATASTLTLTQEQVGKTITIKAAYTDLLGTAESVSSVATGAVTNVNDAPTGTVTITGTAAQDQILTASNTLADVDGLGTIAYQWYAGDIAISGATATTLTLSQAEVGKVITVKAGYTDLQKTAESVTSVATGTVANVNDAPTTSLVTLASITEDSQARIITQVELLGNAVDVDGNNLTATGLSITSGNGTLIDNLNGTWSYTPSLNDDASVSFNYTITDSVSPTAGTVVATASLDITPVNDLPTGTVTITGTATQNQKLTAVSTLADADGLGTIVYQWLADGTAISGTTTSTLILGQAEVGKAITVKASYTDLQKTPESVTSVATAAVNNVNDAPTGTVTITGTATQNQTLAAVSSLADVDGLGTLAYQWLANGTAISGATASILTLDQAQVGKAITVTASYTDLQKTPESVTSSATTHVINVNDAPTGTVT